MAHGTLLSKSGILHADIRQRQAARRCEKARCGHCGGGKDTPQERHSGAIRVLPPTRLLGAGLNQ